MNSLLIKRFVVIPGLNALRHIWSAQCIETVNEMGCRCLATGRGECLGAATASHLDSNEWPDAKEI